VLPSVIGLPAKYATLIPLVGLEVTTISYGSLDLALEFTGLKHLVDLFDANFDLFMMFMAAYLPTAFGASLSELGFLNETDFEFNVVPSGALTTAFATPAGGTTQTPASPSQATAASQKEKSRLKKMWLLTNSTLMVPVALALIVMYVAYKGVVDEKAELAAVRQDV